MLLTELESAAIEKGFRYKIEYPHSYMSIHYIGIINEFDAKTTWKFSIGINPNKDIWYLFEGIVFGDIKELYQNNMLFIQRYNGANGYVMKTINQEIKIMKLLGLW